MNVFGLDENCHHMLNVGMVHLRTVKVLIVAVCTRL